MLTEVHSKISNLEEDPKTYKETISCPQSKLWVEDFKKNVGRIKLDDEEE